MKKILCLAGWCMIAWLAANAASITYTPDNQTVFRNPERGFTEELSSKVSASSPYVVKGEIDDEWGKNDKMTLAVVLYNFGYFKSQDLPNKVLTGFDEDMQELRNYGLKCVLRFAYTEKMSDKVDATPEWVKRHLEQLKPHLEANADVIYVMEAGFIGVWGEWYYTSNYTNKSQKMNDKRRKVIDYLFANAPEDRFILFRYPLIKIGYLGDENTLKAEEAFSGSVRARMGCHNDAFLNDDGNDGTYGRDGDGPDDDPVLRQYIADETLYVPNGGETNVENATLAENVYMKAPEEMAKYHWSFCGSQYAEEVTDEWRESGLFDTLNIHMGYRYNLIDGQFSDAVKQGEKISITIRLRNDGYAPIYNERPVYLVLKNNNSQWSLPLQADPRRWLPNGAETTINEQVTVPGNVPEGTYKLYLFLPDPYPSLAADPRYAVRLANKDIWDAATGMNNLGVSVIVSGTSSLDPGTLPEEDTEGTEQTKSGKREAGRKVLIDGTLYIIYNGTMYNVQGKRVVN